MANVSVRPDQMASAGSFIAREWGDHGYFVEEIRSPSGAVSLFKVCASDGSRFVVLADRWGNCDSVDADRIDAPEVMARWAEMHKQAVSA